MKYTTSGMVDGSCGHAHPTLSLACKCLIKFRSKRNFSDRTVKKLVNGKERLLNSSEVLQVMFSVNGKGKGESCHKRK